MRTQTKNEVLREFVQDLKDLVAKIERNDEMVIDYNRLQEMFELANVPSKLISDCYEGCGFDSWKSLYEERKKSDKKKDVNSIECSLSKIRGISTAVTAQLTNYINSTEKTAPSK